MTEAQRWRDGFAAMACLLGARSSTEIASMLPAGIEVPDWVGALDQAQTREKRATLMAAPTGRLLRSLLETTPSCR
jgi:hypothetical protein